MGRRRKYSQLALWMNGLRAGSWHVDSRGEHTLRYDEAWVDAAHGRPVSLSMPLRPADAPYRGEVVRNFFENLLPDNRAVRERMQARFSAASTSAVDLLTEVGRDCAGALMLMPEGKAPPRVDVLDGDTLTETDIERLLDSVLTTGRHAEGDDFRISIAGAQEKTALLRHDGRWMRPRGATPTTHILKLPLGVAPSGIDLTTSVENEWLCARILDVFHVPVALGDIARFGRHTVLCVPRFDRRKAEHGNWLLRLPQEDFAQVAGVSPDSKYEAEGGPGIRDILDRLRGSRNAETDRLDFFRTQVLFWMLAAIDGHAKNFSVMLLARGAYHLAPRYDVLSAYPVLGHEAGQLSPEKIRMAMALWGRNRHYRWKEIERRHFESTAVSCGLRSVVAAVLDELIERTPGALAEVEAKLPADFPAQLADRVLGGVRQAARQLASHTVARGPLPT